MIYDITDDRLIHRDFLAPEDYGIMFDAYDNADGALNLRIELEEETLWFKRGDFNKSEIREQLQTAI